MKYKFGIVVSVISFISLFFVIDRLIGFSFENKFSEIESGRFGKINKLLVDRENEFMIFGSSRASHHYISSIIEDSLKLSCYNYGGDGEGTIFTCAKILSVVENYSPKIILIETSMDYLSGRFGSELSLFNPFYDKNEVIKKILDESDRFMPIKQQFKSFRYNSTLTSILKDRTSDKSEDGGYVPLYGKMKDTVQLRDYKFNSCLIDDYIKKKFDQVLQTCSVKKIKVILVFSPMFFKIDKIASEKSFFPLIEICKKYNVELLDNSQMENVFDNLSYYQDKIHLNDIGATDYTLKVIEKIKSLNINKNYE